MKAKQKKYIVKNCPCFDENYSSLRFLEECLDLNQTESDCCVYCTSCLIKQIIDKCNKECGLLNNEKSRSGKKLAREILQLFNIEEVE